MSSTPSTSRSPRPDAGHAGQSGNRHLLLIGGGHAHAQVLLDLIRQPLPDLRVTLVTPSRLAPYSGMVPGWLAGTYTFEQICIDVAQLAQACGATLILGEVAAMQADARQLQLTDGRTLTWDWLSLNVGSTLQPPMLDPQTQAATVMLSMRPLAMLRQRWEALLADLACDSARQPLHVTAVGGGAAGVESVLAAVRRLRAACPNRPVQAHLVSRAPNLLAGMAPGAARLAHRALQRAGVEVHLGQSWPAGDPSLACPQSGVVTSAVPAESEPAQVQQIVLWATGAQAHGWQASSGLAVSEDGFFRVNERLQSVSHPEVFAVGDCCAWQPALPKAGVFSVRMGPVLTANLRAAIGAGALQSYRPQRRYLALLATADGLAIGAWGRLSAQGAWLWRWKDRIDRGFLARFEQPHAGGG